MTQNARKGSMLEQEQKDYKVYKIVMAVITVILFSMAYFDLFHTMLHSNMAGISKVWKVAGGLCYGLCLITLLIQQKITDALDNEWLWFVIWIVCLLFAFMIPGGFAAA